MAEDLVEDVRFLQVVELFRGADEGGDRKALAGQQLEEGLEGDQRRHHGDAPAGGGLQHLVDLTELGDAVMGQAELLDAVEVFLARTPLDHFQLPGDQGMPDLVLDFRVMDEAVLVGLAGHVLRMFHRASSAEPCCCIETFLTRAGRLWQGAGEGGGGDSGGFL
ncbi:hypothetical protein FQZ97_924400 [compost metagenome]